MKRLLDLAVAAVLLAALAVPMAVVALAIRATMGAPVLFRQVRPGRGRKRFELCKFRTMSDARDAEGKLLPDHARLTPLGRWLRATSLDELPQLWNVVRGDMSLVGPRPLLCRYLPYFSPRESKRFEVRPGITGWAQIHGRNRVAWDDRLELDAWYIEHWSLGLDLRILIKTAVAVFGRRGTVVDPCSLMPDLDVERATRIERQNDAHRAAC
jgi:lipopolysaccharide/colanic/teichoic acid biosynthesis glycosyltransferase